MEPQIRYARTSDGVSLAWYAVGSGPPFLWMPAGPYTNTQHEWQIPETRATLERIAAVATLVRYDSRGFSMSDREVTDFSLEAMVLDLETVIGATGFDRIVLQSPGVMSVPALVYAARHPEKLTALMLNTGVGRGVDREDPEYQRTLKIARLDWEATKRLVGSTAGGWQMNATVAGLAQMLGLSSTQETYIRWHEAVPEWDASDVLSQVRTPALIIHTPGSPGWLSPWDESRRLATVLPDATFAILTPGVGDDVFQMSANFLAGVAQRATPPSTPPSAVRTVLFTDIVGHTEMMQRLGDAKGRDVLREHERITRETLKAHGGAEVKTMGDGFMASFGSVTSAIECAIALQRAFAASADGSSSTDVGARHASPVSETPPTPASNIQHLTSNIQIRIGLNAGEPIEEDGDLFGATVILASRIAAKAGAGEILVPDTVRGLLSGKGFMFSDRGEFIPKGFDEGVRLWDVRWQE